MTKFLLPCDCGQDVTIETNQAGQSVPCVCGKTLLVPSLRAIRELEPAEPEADAKRPPAEWSPLAGSVFAAGALLVILGLLVFGFGYYTIVALRANLPVRSEVRVQQFLQEVDDAEPIDLFVMWDDAVKRQFTDSDDSPWSQFHAEARKYTIVVRVGIGLLVLGLLLCCGAPFFKK